MEATRNPRWFAYLQLMRIPNVFTAAADVMMGYLVTHGSLQPTLYFALLVVASCLLYLSGMVLNDVFDAEIDARERPDRPIPSGRVTLPAATSLGWGLLASGALIAWFASFVAHDWRPGIVGSFLATCIVLYDLILKRTPIAPLAMGACRTLNVLLGMSLATRAGLAAGVNSDNIEWNSTAAWLIALGIGVYIIGVTWFARTDAGTSSRGQLIGGLTVLVVGMAVLFAVPGLANNIPPLRVGQNGWRLLWAALVLITARRCLLAIYDPTPQRVQAAVRLCVQSIIVLDAAVCVGYASPLWGFAVFALIAPTLVLTAWLEAT